MRMKLAHAKVQKGCQMVFRFSFFPLHLSRNLMLNEFFELNFFYEIFANHAVGITTLLIDLAQHMC